MIPLILAVMGWMTWIPGDTVYHPELLEGE
jgi:hypothetical protein